MITTGFTVGDISTIKCIDGLPCGAQFVGGMVDSDSRIVKLVFSHPSFENILWGQVIPEMDITLTKTWKL